ncbi:hypothetical protein PAPYR_10479 [Paratrimastix pyriformis]|uniref:PKD/REJ-like domain-containing protein n=1 Tax=Paratrimastix pyriformis TaxID=342808 RepID=A0ABQ8U5X0_9EUKA|nr:hypothetical protein PAPYR_10479 [Paratrimastix pyriformis]
MNYVSHFAEKREIISNIFFSPTHNFHSLFSLKGPRDHHHIQDAGFFFFRIPYFFRLPLLLKPWPAHLEALSTQFSQPAVVVGHVITIQYAGTPLSPTSPAWLVTQSTVDLNQTTVDAWPALDAIYPAGSIVTGLMVTLRDAAGAALGCTPTEAAKLTRGVDPRTLRSLQSCTLPELGSFSFPLPYPQQVSLSPSAAPTQLLHPAITATCVSNTSAVVKFTPTTAGPHTLRVLYNNVTFATAPSLLQVTAGPLAPAQTSVLAWPPALSPAGTTLSLALNLRDAYDNLLVGCPATMPTIGLVGPPAQLLALPACNATTGTTRVNFAVFLAGEYSLQFTVNDMLCPQSNVIRVVAGPVMANRSQVMAWPASPSPLGVNVTVVLVMRDMYSNPVPCASLALSNLALSLAPGPLAAAPQEVLCQANTTVHINFAAAAEGNHTITVLYAGAPFATRPGWLVTGAAAPGAFSSAMSYIKALVPMQPLAGETAVALFWERDENGLQITCTPTELAQLAAVLSPGPAYPLTRNATCGSDGSFVLPFATTPNGPHLLSITRAGVVVGNTTFVIVMPNTMNVAKTMVMTWPRQNATTGEMVTVAGMLGDNWGNPLPCDSARLSILMAELSLTLSPGPLTGTPFGPVCQEAYVALSFATAVAGVHTITLFASGTKFAQLTNWTVIPGSLDPSRSGLVSEASGPLPGTAGLPSAFLVRLADTLGNLISCTGRSPDELALLHLILTPAAPVNLSVTCSPADPQYYLMAVTPYRAGSYILTLGYGNVTMLVNGTGWTVAAGSPDAAHTAVVQWPSNSTAAVGDVATAHVQARDAWQNPIECSRLSATLLPSLFSVVLTPGPVRLGSVLISCDWATNASLFAVSWTSDTAGNHSVALTISASGAVVVNGTWPRWALSAGVISAAKSTVDQWPHATAYPAGTVASMLVTLRDATGNVLPCTAASEAERARISVALTPGPLTSLSVTCLLAQYVVAFTTANATNHSVAVYGGGLIATRPAGLMVVADAVSPVTSSLTLAPVSSQQTVTAGAAVTIGITPRDRFGNLIGCTAIGAASLGLFSAVLTPGPLVAALPYCIPGKSLLMFNLTVHAAAVHSLVMLYNQTALTSEVVLPGWTVVAGAPVASGSTVYSWPMYGIGAGGESSVQIQLADAFGNHIACTDPALAPTPGLIASPGPIVLGGTQCLNNMLLVLFSCLRAGTHTLQPTLAAAPVGSKLSLVVAPDFANASSSRVVSWSGIDGTHITRGLAANLTVELRDAYQNVVNCSAGAVAPTYLTATLVPGPLAPGGATWACAGVHFVLTVPTTAAGTHRVTAVLYGRQVTGNTTWTLRPGPLDISTLIVRAMPATASAGTEARMVLNATDSFGNPIRCSSADGLETEPRLGIYATSGALVKGWGVSCVGDDDFEMSFVPAKAGDHQLCVTYDGIVISTTCGAWHVTAGPILASATQFSSLTANASAGSGLAWAVLPQDAFGNLVPLCSLYPGKVSALFAGSLVHTTRNITLPVGLACNGTGIIIATANATLAGLYTTRLLFNGTLAVTGTVRVAAGPVVAAASGVEIWPTSGIAGQTMQFVVNPRDAYGNLLPCTASLAAGLLVQLLSAKTAVAGTGNGSCSADRLVADVSAVNQAGNYTVRVTLGGSPLAGSGLRTVTIVAGPVHPESIVVAQLPTTATGCETTQFAVTVPDQFGNPVGCTTALATLFGLSLTATTDGSVLAGLVSCTATGGAFQASFQPLAAGQFTLSLTYNGVTRASGPVAVASGTTGVCVPPPCDPTCHAGAQCVLQQCRCVAPLLGDGVSVCVSPATLALGPQEAALGGQRPFFAGSRSTVGFALVSEELPVVALVLVPQLWAGSLALSLSATTAGVTLSQETGVAHPTTGVLQAGLRLAGPASAVANLLAAIDVAFDDATEPFTTSLTCAVTVAATGQQLLSALSLHLCPGSPVVTARLSDTLSQITVTLAHPISLAATSAQPTTALCTALFTPATLGLLGTGARCLAVRTSLAEVPVAAAAGVCGSLAGTGAAGRMLIEVQLGTDAAVRPGDHDPFPFCGVAWSKNYGRCASHNFFDSMCVFKALTPTLFTHSRTLSRDTRRYAQSLSLLSGLAFLVPLATSAAPGTLIATPRYITTRANALALLAPVNPPAPVAAIVGPSQISLCAARASFDGSLSARVGSGGRALQYAWTMRLAGDPVTVNLLRNVAGVALDGPVVAVPTANLTAQTAYVLRLEVTNFLGVTASREVTFTAVVDTLPLATIRGVVAEDSPVVITRTVALQLAGQARHACPGLSQSALWFGWTQESQIGPVATVSPAQHSLAAVLPTAGRTSQGLNALARTPALNLPAGTLRAGAVYGFRLWVGYQAQQGANVSVGVLVNVTRSPLQTAIQGARTIGAEDTLTLDGTASRDPDSGDASGLTYEWRLSGASCFPSSLASTAGLWCPYEDLSRCRQSTLVLPTAARAPGDCLATLAVTKNGRAASAQASFRVQAGAPPPAVSLWSTTILPTVALPSSSSEDSTATQLAIPPSATPSFAGLATGGVITTYRWSQDSGPTIGWALALGCEAGEVEARLARRTLVLGAGTLTPGDYVMRLSATSAEGTIGSASIGFRVTGAPFGGSVGLDVTSGVPLSTQFTVKWDVENPTASICRAFMCFATATSWSAPTSADLPLRYRFLYAPSSSSSTSTSCTPDLTGLRRLTEVPAEEPSATFKLPAGSFCVGVEVLTRSGAAAVGWAAGGVAVALSADQMTSIGQNSTAFAEQLLSDTVASALALGETSTALQSLDMLAGVLNTVEGGGSAEAHQATRQLLMTTIEGTLGTAQASGGGTMPVEDRTRAVSAIAAVSARPEEMSLAAQQLAVGLVATTFAADANESTPRFDSDLTLTYFTSLDRLLAAGALASTTTAATGGAIGGGAGLAGAASPVVQAASGLVHRLARVRGLAMVPGSEPQAVTSDGNQTSLATQRLFPDQLASTTLRAPAIGGRPAGSFALPANLSLPTTTGTDPLVWTLITETQTVHDLAKFTLSRNATGTGQVNVTSTRNVTTASSVAGAMSLTLWEGVEGGELSVDGLPATSPITITMPLTLRPTDLPAGLILPANATALAAANLSMVPMFYNASTDRWEDGGCVMVDLRLVEGGGALVATFDCQHLTTYTVLGFIQVNVIDIPPDQLFAELSKNLVALIVPCVIGSFEMASPPPPQMGSASPRPAADQPPKDPGMNLDAFQGPLMPTQIIALQDVGHDEVIGPDQQQEMLLMPGVASPSPAPSPPTLVPSPRQQQEQVTVMMMQQQMPAGPSATTITLTAAPAPAAPRSTSPAPPPAWLAHPGSLPIAPAIPGVVYNNTASFDPKATGSNPGSPVPMIPKNPDVAGSIPAGSPIPMISLPPAVVVAISPAPGSANMSRAGSPVPDRIPLMMSSNSGAEVAMTTTTTTTASQQQQQQPSEKRDPVLGRSPRRNCAALGGTLRTVFAKMQHLDPDGAKGGGRALVLTALSLLGEDEAGDENDLELKRLKRTRGGRQASFWYKLWRKLRNGITEHQLVDVFMFRKYDLYSRPRRLTVLCLSVMLFFTITALFYTDGCDTEAELQQTAACGGYLWWQDILVGLPCRVMGWLFGHTRLRGLNIEPPEKTSRLARWLPCMRQVARFRMPWWTATFIWYPICWAGIVLGGYYSVLYALYFSATKTRGWLFSSGSSFLQDNFIQEPIILVATSLLTAAATQLL